jgi:ankyrin repeat protein
LDPRFFNSEDKSDSAKPPKIRKSFTFIFRASAGDQIERDALSTYLKWDNIELLQVLFESNPTLVNIRKTTKPTSETLLHMAVMRNNINMVKLLLNNKANTEAKASDKSLTPLLMLVKSLFYISPYTSDIIRILVDHGAAINAQDYHKNTALHLAAKNENLRLVDLLLKLNADPTVRNHHNKLASDYVTLNKKLKKQLKDAEENWAFAKRLTSNFSSDILHSPPTNRP